MLTWAGLLLSQLTKWSDYLVSRKYIRQRGDRCRPKCVDRLLLQPFFLCGSADHVQDHAAYTTAEGAYHGQAGYYLLIDPAEASLGLPSGNYDLGMGLESKQYDEEGDLVFDTHNNTGLWGDIIQVNGQPWPYLEVEPRKYRFRVLDGAISRSTSCRPPHSIEVSDHFKVFRISMTADEGDGTPIPFHVISTDGGMSPQLTGTDQPYSFIV